MSNVIHINHNSFFKLKINIICFNFYWRVFVQFFFFFISLHSICFPYTYVSISTQLVQQLIIFLFMVCHMMAKRNANHKTKSFIDERNCTQKKAKNKRNHHKLHNGQANWPTGRPDIISNNMQTTELNHYSICTI